MPIHIYALLVGALIDLIVGDPEWFYHQFALGGLEGARALACSEEKPLGEGSVPWDEVFREYEETETRSAERENLTTKERQWVKDYYSLLTDQR